VQANPRGIISMSLGGCETAEGSSTVHAEGNVFAQADALGESVFVASGDSGAYSCLDQDWGASPSPEYIGVSSPASEPGVTAVGGTRLSLHTNSTWYREEVWQDTASTAGSGGGLSAYFTRPSWQRGPGVVNSFNTSNRREVPDVAADADPLSSVQIVVGGQVVQEGGTSQAAPIWAGITALVNQYLRQRGQTAAGFVNPALYALAAGTPAYPPFHDVTVGNNLAYPATPGYDLATGLGTPDAWNLARDLAAYKGGKQ
jgi:kumamolisin